MDAEGFVDYLEAANARHANEIQPEDNWEVVLRRAFGPIDWDEASDREYYRRLRIPPVDRNAAKGMYYQSAHELGDNPTEAQKKLDDQFGKIETPWQSEDFPESARYLESQAHILDQLVAGSRVTGYYHPYAVSPEGHAAQVRAIRGFADEYAKSGSNAERFAAGVFKSIFAGLPEEVHRSCVYTPCQFKTAESYRARCINARCCGWAKATSFGHKRIYLRFIASVDS
ncbi:MAG: hypothetical protein CMJ64_23340 [Planctomycetaceae bacterium]|nr:hypothetical protein [Planctomycetaceae bacterium]